MIVTLPGDFVSKSIVIIPAFNEENSILLIVRRLEYLYPDFDILVINDGSQDDTETEVNKSKAKLINHPFNLGYGTTIQTGYKYAYHNGYDYLIQLDADGQHDVESLKNIYKELISGKADLILGSRFFSSSTYKPDFFRKIGMKLFRFIVNKITKLNLSDVTTGFQGMNRKVLFEFIKDTFPFEYPDADVIVMAHKKGIRIKEVPVLMYENKTGKSIHSSPIKNIIYVIQMLISLAILLIQKNRV